MKPITRRNTRVYCGFPAQLEGPTGSIKGVLRSISRGGAFFQATRLVQVGQTVELKISLPGIPPVKATGEVRYHFRYADGEGMGIRFVRLGGEDLEYIGQFVNARVGA